MAKADLPINGVEALAHALAAAWFRYRHNFGEVPHGTPAQLAALIELAGGNDTVIRIGRVAEVAKMAQGMRRMASKQKKSHDIAEK